MRAVEVLRELDGEGLEPTDADLAALAAYAGWGGAQDAFREDSDAGPAWSALNARLRELLSDEEYADACALFGELGLGGFFQQDESISESFIPAFDGTGLEDT